MEIEINNYWTEFVQFENLCKSKTDTNWMKCKKKMTNYNWQKVIKKREEKASNEQPKLVSVCEVYWKCKPKKFTIQKFQQQKF